MSVELGRYAYLKTIVAMAIDECKKTIADFDRYWIFAFRAMVRLGFETAWEPLTLRLPLNGNNTVTLPRDYMAWCKIGILNANNEVSVLKVNKSLTTLRDVNPNRQTYLGPDVPDVDFTNFVINPYFLNYYFGNWYTPLFGLGNGLVTYGDCRIDEKNNVIIMGPSYPFDSVILEYISSPKMNGDYMIETCLTETVIAFIKWKERLGSEQEFYAEYRVARRSLKPITLQTMNQSIREKEGYKVKS